MLLIPSLLVRGVSGWDRRGHKIVAKLTGNLIRPKTARYIRELFPEYRGAITALVEGAGWADTVTDVYPWSADFHFSHTPFRDCQPFDFTRDCGVDGSGRCLVTAITNYTGRAADIALDSTQRSEAIKFLVHLLADSHQGLHVGFADDLGGNRINLIDPHDTNLHEAWDSYLLDAHIGSLPATADRSWYGVASNLLADLHIDPINDWLISASQVGIGFAASIVTETATTITCTHAYRDEPGGWIPRSGHSLTSAYIETAKAIMLSQFKRAAVRLAQLLDSVAAAYFKAEHLSMVAARDAVPALGAGAGAGAASTNQFAVLTIDMDLDPEDYVWDLPSVADDGMIESDEDMPVVEMVSTTTSTTTTTGVPITRSPEERKQRKKEKERLAKAVKKRSVSGVDIESVVLIKRYKEFYLTLKHFVTSDKFIPRVLLAVDVRMTGSASEGSGVYWVDRDMFKGNDWEVGPLVDAIFKKLQGLPYKTGGVEDGPTAAPTGTHVPELGVPGVVEAVGTLRDQGMVGWEVVEELSELAVSKGLPPIRDGAYVDRVADLLAPPPTRRELVARYGRDIPSPDKVVQDNLSAQLANLVVVQVGEKAWMLSRDDLLANITNLRWVFNRAELVLSPTMDTHAWFIDARVVDSADLPFEWILANMFTAKKRKQTQVVARRHPRIVKALFLQCLIADGDRDPRVIHDFLATFQRITGINRPDLAAVNTFEYILRSQAESDQVARRLQDAVAPRATHLRK